MAAKIIIDADNPALNLALGVIIAQAIRDAGFTNAMSKMVTLTVPTLTDAKSEPIRNPPELKSLDWIIPPGVGDLAASMVTRSPGMLDEPLVLDFLPDSSAQYTAQANYFLLTGKRLDN